MFCTGCGSQLIPNSAFCGRCGVSTGAPPQAAPQQQPIYPATQPPAVVTPSNSRAFAAVLAIILIVSMAYGWVSFNFEDDRPLSWGNFAGIRVMAWDAEQSLERELEWASGSAEWAAEIEAQFTPTISFGFLGTILWLATTASIVMLMMFINFMLRGDRRARSIGQAGSLVAAISALVFLYRYHVTGFEDLLWTNWQTSTPSIWAYLTLVMGVACFAYITQRKQEI